jgi:Dyp-type peroxidase family
MTRTLAQMLADPRPITREQMDESEYRTLLGDLQGNILTAHGFDQARYFFLTFKDDQGDVDALKYLFAMLAQGEFDRAARHDALVKVSDPAEADAARARQGGSAKSKPDAQRRKPRIPKRLKQAVGGWKERRLLEDGCFDDLLPLAVASERAIYLRRDAERIAKRENRQREGEHVSGDGFSVNILLSTWGYQKLEVEKPSDAAFRDGMASRQIKLKDPKRFEGEYDRKIDAVVIVAHRGGDAAKASLESLQATLRARAAQLSIENGHVLRPAGVPIEPFGYRDAISQPIFYQDHLNALLARGAVAPEFDVTAKLGLALVPDPNGTTPYSCGSYFVFRKLKQDVGRFYAFTDHLKQDQGAEIRERLIGRKLDGTPLVGGGPEDNKFDFSNDKDGAKCPFFAHARKMNPRSDLDPIYDGRAHRIVRRGMVFGPELKRNADGSPVRPLSHDEPVGLLFLCAQANIPDGFEHLQSRWANPSDHPRGKPTGVDPIMGQLSPGQQNQLTDGFGTAKFDPFVTLEGGEYFFAPSLSFLRNLFNELLDD